MLGAGTGYRRYIMPMIIPSVKLGYVRVAFLPKTEATNSALVHFTIEKEFK